MKKVTFLITLFVSLCYYAKAQNKILGSTWLIKDVYIMNVIDLKISDNHGNELLLRGNNIQIIGDTTKCILMALKNLQKVTRNNAYFYNLLFNHKHLKTFRSVGSRKNK